MLLKKDEIFQFTVTGSGGDPVFKLDRWETKDEVVAAIDLIEITQERVQKYVQNGLFATRIIILQSWDGDRPEVPNVIVVLTDVVPNSTISKLMEEVDRVKATGASIIGIEVANSVCIPIIFSAVV